MSDQFPGLIKLIHDRFTARPEKVAYTFLEESGTSRTLTYGTLHRKASAIANYLMSGERDEQPRALLVYSPGFDFITALFACFLSNTIAIPIAIPKPKTTDLFRHFMSHARPHFILTSADLAPRMEKLMTTAEIQACPLISTDTLEAMPAGIAPHFRGGETAIIQYTSGTTTNPKGVLVNFDQIALNLGAIKQHFHLAPSSVCFSWLPHYHDMGLIDGLLTPMFNDCTGLVCSPLNVVANPLRWMEIITTHKVTHTGGPNFFFDLCTARIAAPALESIDLRSLSHVYVSAEPVRKKTLENFATHFGKVGFSLNMFTPGYGLAEATLMVTCKPIHSALHFLTFEGKTHVGLGYPVPGIDIRISHPETQQDVEEGKPGEICLNGPTITRGYYQNQSQTSKSFTTLLKGNVASPYFKTGDIGILKEGELYVIGRLKDTLIVRGLKYQPEDLEYVITNSHASLAAMFGAVFTTDEESGEKLIVLQEIKKESTAPAAEIKHAIKKSVFESFGLTVFDIILLPFGKIARTTSGKIKRSDNRLRYLKGEFSEFA